MFLVLQAWYDDYNPAKRRKSGGRTTCIIQVNELAPLTFDDFAESTPTPWRMNPRQRPLRAVQQRQLRPLQQRQRHRQQPLHAEPRQQGIEN